MRLGYNTNGFAQHRMEDALAILAELGYQSAAITLDYHTLNPYEPDLPRRAAEVRRLLDRLGLHCVIETGARFLLDPRRKHQPTLVSPQAGERQRRLDFLCRAVEVSHILKADALSFWSGTPVNDASREEHLARLVAGCRSLCAIAEQYQVRLAFEPEPGMLIDTMARFQELYERVNHPLFGLTLDVGHLHCLGETPVADQVRRWDRCLWNVHIEDMRRGVHEHLQFGEGEMYFPPILAALRDIGYDGGIHVELSRHSHDAVNSARRARAFLESVM
jgi:L-ribulose-5-phosphate 3-epimerase